jgi:hypothetical protein
MQTRFQEKQLTDKYWSLHVKEHSLLLTRRRPSTRNLNRSSSSFIFKSFGAVLFVYCPSQFSSTIFQTPYHLMYSTSFLYSFFVFSSCCQTSPQFFGNSFKGVIFTILIFNNFVILLSNPFDLFT